MIQGYRTLTVRLPFLFHLSFRYLLLGFALVAAGCSTPTSLELKDIAKSDIDMVADLHIEVTRSLVIELTEKLYKRNPRELNKKPGATIYSRLNELKHNGRLKFTELNMKQGIEAMDLALSPDFKGDRVFALMAGLIDVLRHSYGYRDELFVLDDLDQQKLYICARNIEILMWRLKQARDENGELLIYTNATGAEINLSFERLFGKLIAHQDMMARIMADKTQRAINKVAHSIVSMTFIPL
ncbi:hypothetical protein ACWJJH_05200 [Endozoicomonadaceae bacterium StTr2]